MDKITEETSAVCCLSEQGKVFSKNICRYVKPSTPLNSFTYLLFCLPCQLQQRCLRVPALLYYAKLIQLLLMMSKLLSNKVLSKVGFSNNKESDLQQICASEII